MYPRVAYLDWALEHIAGRYAFDLATSGMPNADFDEAPRPADRVALRAAIARYNGVSPEEVMPALGTAHAVWLAYATLLSPGDEVLVEEPSYEPLLSAAQGVGATIVRFPRPNFAVDPALIAERVTQKTRLVVVSNLHNPSGVRTSDETLRALARALSPTYLLVDEVYAPFDELADDGVWPRSARRLGDNVVTAGSLTKCYGVGQHRFGWMLGPPDVIERARDVMLATCVMLPAVHVGLFQLALDRLPSLSQRARHLLGDKRARVRAWLESEHPELAWSRPKEGLFGFATLPGAGDLQPAIEAGAKEHGVIVSPGVFFGVPNGFRLSWSIEASRLDEALSRLSRVLGGVSRARVT